MELDWSTDSDIASFLGQYEPVADFLEDKMDVIRSASRPEEKHAVIWCVTNLIPLAQFHPGTLNVVFCEDLVQRPEPTVARIFQAIGCDYKNSVFQSLTKPSSTATRFSAIVSDVDPLTR